MPRPGSFRAVRLPRLAGPAAWDSILGPRPAAPPPEGTRRADFVVIGGGFAGLSAARRLLQLAPEAKIAVLDAGQIGQGSAGRNSGFMIDLPHELTSEDYAGADTGSDRTLIALNRQAIAFAAEAVQEYAIPAGYFRRDGKVNGAASRHADAQNTAYAKHLALIQERYEVLDAKAMRDLTGSAYYRSGLYTPGTVMIQPAGYIRGLLAGLSRRVAVHEDTPVTDLIRCDHGWQVVTPQGRIDAGTVILANNGHLESFGFARRRLMHIFLFACMTEELSPDALRRTGGADCWGITPSDPMGTTMRRISTAQGGNRIITRTMAKFLPHMVTSGCQMRRAMTMMRAKFDARYPQLADVRMEFGWSGHLCLTQNNSSVAGRLDEDLFAACVCNGLGTTRSTLTGIAAAEAALGHDSAITRFFAAQHLPARLPPAPLAQIGANLFIRWKEWRARKE
ncbi:NAD(P)/FAD-dependent oxidoreductase [Paenirhodobacter populi]|uniref:FAD-binding oxidoreductase n=1 Tax=Paenirhodobacter populi TaxID=2306993 RepID=A0A443J8Q7_9RHOB|nr:FAD-binding oxidoreductase [Sinirhodobacter populi]RWR04334.1 FAD-binding oxidoreductase [Sinirhodobacter populi]RWR16887.1 FAD-binding oxidoreductase [Sinirhodobacter populi]